MSVAVDGDKVKKKTHIKQTRKKAVNIHGSTHYFCHLILSFNIS